MLEKKNIINTRKTSFLTIVINNNFIIFFIHERFYLINVLTLFSMTGRQAIKSIIRYLIYK